MSAATFCTLYPLTGNICPSNRYPDFTLTATGKFRCAQRSAGQDANTTSTNDTAISISAFEDFCPKAIIPFLFFCPVLHYIVSDQSRSEAIENEPDNLPVREHHIWVSRRLIYGQAALLGVSAATFFMLGMMVGNLTSSASSNGIPIQKTQSYAEDCRVSGLVTYQKNGNEFPDQGAVVLLFPRKGTPEKRQAPGLVMPNTFVALDNPTIEAIHNGGGAVVRADSDGKFEVLVDLNREYRLLVVSKNRTPKGTLLTEPQQKMLEAWFAPAEKLVRDNDFQWRDVSGNAERVDAGVIAFE